jgi:hypothetical protein
VLGAKLGTKEYSLHDSKTKHIKQTNTTVFDRLVRAAVSFKEEPENN